MRKGSVCRFVWCFRTGKTDWMKPSDRTDERSHNPLAEANRSIKRSNVLCAHVLWAGSNGMASLENIEPCWISVPYRSVRLKRVSQTIHLNACMMHTTAQALWRKEPSLFCGQACLGLNILYSLSCEPLNPIPHEPGVNCVPLHRHESRPKIPSPKAHNWAVFYGIKLNHSTIHFRAVALIHQ